jgi:hypothetical protein
MSMATGNDKQIHEWLKRAKIYTDGQAVRRVVIDIAVEEPVRVYVEQYGTDALLDVQPPDMSGAKVAILKKAEEWARPRAATS